MKYPPPLSEQELDVLERTATIALRVAGVADSLTGTFASQEAQHAYLWLRLVGMIRAEQGRKMPSTMSNQVRPMTDEALSVWAQLAKERAGQEVTIRASALDELVTEIKRLKAHNQHIDSHAYGHLESCKEIHNLMHVRYGEAVPLPICTTPKAWANRS